ncbi:MAG: DUF2213 domain-containing protein [Candidatus Scalindua sp.]|jgi:hypothetical protein|nr:DUF2213 domain-containing protein [Candidatus Scalindua sp.]
MDKTENAVITVETEDATITIDTDKVTDSDEVVEEIGEDVLSPNEGEAHDTFLNRCMVFPAMMKDFPMQRDRWTACTQTFEGVHQNMVSNSLVAQVSNFSMRREVKDGIPHIVVPIVALVEGVHSGSGGAVMHSASEIQRTAGDWNGTPLTLNHPTVGGNSVSALNPTIMKQWSVGSFENVFYEGGKLKGEGWINVEKLSQLSPETLVRIKQGEELEVSTGFFSATDSIEGTWKGEKFEGTVMDIVPDHLALLPHDEGACSMKDGCGIRDEGECETCRVNNSTLELVQAGTEETIIEPQGGEEKIKVNVNELKKQGFYVNELSHSKLREALIQRVNAMDTSGTMHFLREVFDDHFIFEKLSADGTQLFSQKFSIKSNNDELKIKGEPKEVREKVEFIPLEVNKNSKIEEAVMLRKDLVEALITNAETPYDEDDRDSLVAMSEEKFENVVKFVDCKCKEEAVTTNKEEVKEEVKKEITVNEEKEVGDTKMTYAELLENAAPEDREFIENGTAMYKEEKAKAVNALVENSRNPFSKETLEAKSLKELKELAVLGNVPVSFEGNNPDTSVKVPKAGERQTDGKGVPTVQTLSSFIREAK